MSNALVSFLFTAGATTWIYTKLQQYTGNNIKQSLIASGVCAMLIFMIFDFILGLVH